MPITYFEYDELGNRTAIVDERGKTEFAYDAVNRRFFKQTTDESTYFFYDTPGATRLVQERDDSDGLAAQYTLGRGLESQRRDSTSTFYHYDALGSTHQLTAANEDVTDTWRYDAWGNVLVRTGTTVNAHTYVGRLRYYRDAASGLHLLGVRYYDVRLGRFVTVDPLRSAGNWYGYAGGRATTWIDAGGLAREKQGQEGKAKECCGPIVDKWFHEEARAHVHFLMLSCASLVILR